MNSDTHADVGRGGSDGGQGSVQGRYYPVKGGSSSNWTRTNSPWRPTASGDAVGRGLGDVSPRKRRSFVHGGDESGSGGTRSSPKGYSSRDRTSPGADGPDGSGGGTMHTKCTWFDDNKNKTGSGSGDMSTGMNKNSNAGGLSNTVPYGSDAAGSGNGGKVRRKTGY